MERLVTFRMDDRPERRGVSGGCPDGAVPGPEGIEVDGFEAAYTPRGGGARECSDNPENRTLVRQGVTSQHRNMG